MFAACPFIPPSVLSICLSVHPSVYPDNQPTDPLADQKTDLLTSDSRFCLRNFYLTALKDSGVLLSPQRAGEQSGRQAAG